MAEVVAVSASPTHTFSKPRRPAIRLLAGLGVEGDAHLGETVTTRGVDLVALPTGTRLHLGGDAVVEVTGLRNPCFQIDDFQHGVLKEVLGRDENGGGPA